MRSKKVTSKVCSAVPDSIMLGQSGAVRGKKEKRPMPEKPESPIASDQVLVGRKKVLDGFRFLILAERAEPKIKPSPDVAEFLQQSDLLELEEEDVPANVNAYLLEDQRLLAAKMAYFARMKGVGRFLTKAVKDHGRHLIPVIEQLRRTKTYNDETLDEMLSYVNAKTTPSPEYSEPGDNADLGEGTDEL